MAFIGDMTGRVVLVTGAGSGLGRATALALARAGACLCILDVKREWLDETAAMLRELGCEPLVHPADLAQSETCRAAVDATVARFGRLDGLCNVAGIVIFADAHAMAEADWAKTIAVNLTAPFLLSQAAIPHLLERDGAIVNVVSTAAFLGEAYLGAYCASKAGLLQLTKAMAMEYVHKPIRINAIAPGVMNTNIGIAMKLPEGADTALIARYSGLRGTVEPDDVGEMIAHLVSPAARGFHGTCVTLDAGVAAG